MKAYLLIVVVILASGCASVSDSPAENETVETDFEGQESPDSNPTFSELASKAESTNYHVKYTLEGLGPLMYDGTPEVFSYNGVRKVSRFGNLSSFNFGGNENGYYNVYYTKDLQIDCIEGWDTGNGCSTLPTDGAPSVDYYDYRIDRFNVSRLGTRDVLGRRCHLFELSGGDFINSKLDICLDEKKGYAAFLEMKTLGNVSRTTMEMEATEFNMDVSAEDVKLPVDAVSYLTCTDGSLNITKNRFSGDVKFNLNGKENRTASLEAWSTETFDVSDSIEEGLNTATVYAGGTSDSSECRSTSYDY